ncbi:heterokaryon incompatibility protein-domain-containing protein [Nemania sp. FL0916]|nr:heterokaryon incompatibility protein-domain-containing protein [Nemania sp. FL0916]
MATDFTSLELTTDASGLNFEAFYLAHMLRKSALASIKVWLEHENREGPMEYELERLESAWTICLDFFIPRFDPVLKTSLLDNGVHYRPLISPTRQQSPIPVNVSLDIMLLTLQPATDTSKPIECTLHTSSLQQQPCPVYDVLSYAWENPQEIKQISLNGAPFKVQKSLESALRHLRLPHTPRILWADALCVIGRDIQAWSDDVNRLTPIYAKAREVIVWLGNESDASDIAFSFLKEFSKHSQEMQAELVLLLFHSNDLRDRLDPLSNLLRRSWWDRTGLLQELISGCKVTLWCGTRSISWDIVSRFFHVLHEQTTSIEYEKTPYRAWQIPHLIPIGSIGYFPSLRRVFLGDDKAGGVRVLNDRFLAPWKGIGLPGIAEALTCILERIFQRSNLATAWTLALARIGANFGSFMAYIALKLSLDDVVNRQADISTAFRATRPDKFPNLLNELHGKPSEDNDPEILKDLIDVAEDSGMSREFSFERSWTKTSGEVYSASSKDQISLMEALKCWMEILNTFKANEVSRNQNSYQEQTAWVDHQLQVETKMATLLHINPSDEKDSEIFCDSIQVDMGAIIALGVDHGPHSVLSLSWKKGEPKDTIHIDGKQIQIFSEYVPILRSLRKIDLPVLLWSSVIYANGEHGTEVEDLMNLTAGHIFICGEEYCDSLPGLTGYLLQIYKQKSEARPAVLPVILPLSQLGGAVPNIQHYPYRALPKRTSIRLLEVVPLGNTETQEDIYSPIQCSINTVDLEDSPDYNALSYTWGDPLGIYGASQKIVPPSQWYVRDFEIECNGKPVSISANLYTALISFRWMLNEYQEPDNGQHSHYLWVDAVCINQSDKNERSQQVALMSRIYQGARHVYVWLGGEDDLVKPAFDLMSLLAWKAIENIRVFDGIRDSNLNFKSESTYQLLGLPRIPFWQWMALYAFLSRSWFTRAWIVQEISHAKSVRMFFGTDRMKFAMLHLVMMVLHRSGWGEQLTEKGKAFLENDRASSGITTIASGLKKSHPSSGFDFDNIIRILEARGRLGFFDTESFYIRPHANKPEQLITNVARFRNFQAKEPRDKIYAFMNISSEFLDHPLDSEKISLIPNYGLTEREVFIQASTFMLQSGGNLELLSLVQDKVETTMKDLPSWVPDFSIGGVNEPLEYGNPSPFTAADGLGPVFLAFPLPSVLEVQGICIGTISYATQFGSNNLSKSVDLLSKLASVMSEVPELSAISRPQLTNRLRHFILCGVWDFSEKTRSDFLQAPTLGHAVEHQYQFEVLWRTMLADSSPARHPLPKDTGARMRSLFQDIINKLQVEARGYLSTGDQEATHKIAHLTKEYTAFQQLLGENPQVVSPCLPPEFVEFVHAFQHSDAFPLDTAMQQHDRVLARSMEIAYETLTRKILDQNYGLSNRSLFRTKTGQVGRGAFSNSPGDEVWLLAGGNVPFTLRKVSDRRYRLVGECYVHGIMHGEAVVNATEKVTTISLV